MIDRTFGLADNLRNSTRSCHIQAERSGVIHKILQGNASHEAYISFLRNLLPVYQQLKQELERHRQISFIDKVADPNLFRSSAIISDLFALSGHEVLQRFPILPAAARYAERIALVSDTHPSGLIAHAYTRYLGDLNGGLIIIRLLSRSMQLTPECLTFYAYPGIDLESFKSIYRERFDLAGVDIVDTSLVLDEAVLAFELNIALSEAVDMAAT